jgi:hypothetical protein
MKIFLIGLTFLENNWEIVCEIPIFSLSLCPLSPERLKWVRDGGGVRESN